MKGKPSNVDVTRVSEALVKASLRTAKLPDTGSLSECVNRLAEHYAATVPTKSLGECKTCKGESDVSLDRCPFCGDDGSDVEVGGTIVQARVHGGSVVPINEVELDNAVKRVHKLLADGRGALYDVAVELSKLFELQLWKLRLTDTGESQYKNWGQFTTSEFGMSPAYAYKLMDLPKNFSREVLTAVGPSKLIIAMQAPPSERPALVEAALAGESKEGLREKAQAVSTGEHRETGRKKMPTSPATQRGEKAPKLTVAMLLGRVEIPLYTGVGKARQPARDLSSPSAGVERMVNGVAQRFILNKNKKGEIILVIERLRESDSAPSEAKSDEAPKVVKTTKAK